nr:alpha-ketoacid dehydrogenase subunit beta [Chitinophagales bacterium]
RDDDPVLFFESEVMYGDVGEVPEEEYLIPIGKANISRPGNDVTIVSYNKMMKVALSAADQLQKEGISAEVIDLRTIRPLDFETIVDSVKKTNRLVVLEEAWPYGSVTSEVAFQVQKHGFDYLDAPVKRITTLDTSIAYAPTLVEAFLPNPEKVIRAVKEALYLV